MNREIRKAAFEAVCAYWRTGLPWKVPKGSVLLSERVILTWAIVR